MDVGTRERRVTKSKWRFQTRRYLGSDALLNEHVLGRGSPGAILIGRVNDQSGIIFRRHALAPSWTGNGEGQSPAWGTMQNGRFGAVGVGKPEASRFDDLAS